MTTTLKPMVYRQQAQGTRPGGVDTPAYLMVPDGVIDLTIWAIADAATSCKIWETYDDPGTTGLAACTWSSVDSTLDSVGTTGVRFQLGSRTPVAFKVQSLTSAKTATLVLTGKKMR